MRKVKLITESFVRNMKRQFTLKNRYIFRHNLNFKCTSYTGRDPHDRCNYYLSLLDNHISTWTVLASFIYTSSPHVCHAALLQLVMKCHKMSKCLQIFCWHKWSVYHFFTNKLIKVIFAYTTPFSYYLIKSSHTKINLFDHAKCLWLPTKNNANY